MAATTAEMMKIALRYAQALCDVSDSQKVTDKVLADMQALKAAYDEQADLRAFVNDPLSSVAAQDATIQQIAKKAKLQALTVNTLRALVDNRRLSVLPHLIDAFTQETERRAGIVNADVTSAYPLKADQTKALEDALARLAGNKVNLAVTVDKTLLGGLTIRLGSTVIDDSVAGRLARLRQSMTQAANA